MSRETASSTIACVDGPNAVRSARRMNASSSALPVELRVGLDQVVDEAYGELGRGQPDLLVDVAEDHVVDALAALDAAGLAAPDVVADHLLERQRAVLGDVAEPGALVEPLDEAAAAAARAGVLAQPGQHLEEVVGEAREGVGRELLQRPEVDDQVDRLLVGPDVRAAIDPGLEDRQVRRGAFGHEGAPSWWGDPRSSCACGPAAAAAPTVTRRRRRCRGRAGAGPGRPRRSRPPPPGRRRAGCGIRVRVVRSNRAPSGSTCRVTPLASSGRRALGLVGVGDDPLAGSKIVTAPRPTTRSTSWPSTSSTTAAVSSSTPMPSRDGDWLTIISSRP